MDEHQRGGHDGDEEGEGADEFEETRGANVFTEGHTCRNCERHLGRSSEFER